MASVASVIPQQRVFRIFISYASEDLAIATAVASCFKKALPDFFAEVNLDKDFLEPGSAFQAQIEAKLQSTDVLVIVYTGAEKRSHSYTGWEIGYFDRIMRMEAGNRKKISLYLFGPPDTTASDQGVPLGLSKNQLELTMQEFETALSVQPAEPLCREIETWQQLVSGNMVSMGFPRPQYQTEQEPDKCVRNLKLSIFQYLKTTIETVVKPQKQITIRVKGSALDLSADNLPPDAEIRPASALGAGRSLDIFGLSDEETTWGKFLDATSSHQYGDAWRQAVSAVVLSSYPDRVNVDNSQVVVATDGTPYRVILTTATKFYDDFREYSLCFVEVLQREDQGDADTTYLLKGLELVCRFRSAFLERTSKFLGDNVGLVQPAHLPKLASELLKELNFLHRDAQEAGMDEPGTLAKYVDLDHIRTIAEAYRPAESKLREVISKIMGARGQVAILKPLGDQMAQILTEMEKVVRPENALLLGEMVTQLGKVVKQQDQS
jgi:hypothetical protein